MDINFPIANPIRFRIVQDASTSIAIDYINRMPQLSLMEIGENYQTGIFAIDNAPRWKINEPLNFQANGPFTYKIGIMKGPGISTSIPSTAITPSGYVGGSVWKWSYTPTVAGLYYVQLYVSDATGSHQALSDIFYVTDNLPEDKNLIELQFFSDENKNGFIFDDYYKAYYTGHFKKAGQQRSSSESDEDTISLLATKSRAKIAVTITDIFHGYYDVVAKQLENESILLNGIEYICREAPEISYNDKSDLVNITFELTGKYDNDYIIFA